jgi:hypothetical protein
MVGKIRPISEDYGEKEEDNGKDRSQCMPRSSDDFLFQPAIIPLSIGISL